MTASATKVTRGGPLRCDELCRPPTEADFVPPFPFTFAMEISGKLPNTETATSDGDFAGGGASHADFTGGGVEVVVGRGEVTLVLFGGVGVRAADETPPFAFVGAFGGGRDGAMLIISSSFGNAVPAALAAF